MVSPLACIVVATVRATTYNLAFSFAWHQPWRSSWGSGFRPYIVAGAVVAFGPARHTLLAVRGPHIGSFSTDSRSSGYSSDPSPD